MTKRLNQDVTGHEFGQLIALERVPGRRKNSWLTRCACGSQKVFALTDLLNGYRKSCGCRRASRGVITYQGETKTVPEWARSIGMRPATLYDRLRKLSVEEAICGSYKAHSFRRDDNDAESLRQFNQLLHSLQTHERSFDLPLLGV